MTQRKGLGKGMGMGYKNIVQQDPYIHSLSAKGVKTRLNAKKDWKKIKLDKYDESGDIIYKNPIKDELVVSYDNTLKETPYRFDIYEKGKHICVHFKTEKEAIETAKKYMKLNAKHKNPVNSLNLVGYIMEYEDGNLTSDDTLYLFSYLIKTGKAWTLQGSYGRMAKGFIDNGYIDNKGKINWYNASNFYAKGTKLNAIGKVWTQVVRKILPHETRVKGKIANTLRDDEIETILATMEFFGASDQVIAQAHSDMKIPRYRLGDMLGMFIQNEGYDKVGGETATKVLAHAYIKADGDIDKMIQDLRENDYQVDTSWEKINLREE